MKGHACAVRTNPPKKLLWLVFYFVTCSAIEGPYCSTSQKFSHQNKQAQEACNTGISVFFPFTLSNNWSLLFLGIATYNKKTRNYLKLHIFQDVFASQLSQLFCPESQIPYTVRPFSTPTYTMRPVNASSLTMPMTVKGSEPVSGRVTD